MNKTIHRGVRYALMAGAVSALTIPAVFAQSVSASNPQSQGTTTTTAELGKIEVTGTRIKRTSVETAQPITVITAKQIRESGLTTVSAVLQNITQAGASLTQEAEIQGKAGDSTINLRYFGASRVLVLVNGRRWTPGLGGTVDLTGLPASVIDHIEILQDGASAIYGSDAITGVVNIITVKNFNGAEAHAYMGIYNNNYGGVTGWDGKKQSYDFTFGQSGSKGGIVINAQYSDSDPVWSRNRVQSREPIWTQGSSALTLNAPGLFTIQSPQLANQKVGDATCSKTGSCGLSLKNFPTDNPTLSNFVGASALNYDEQLWRMFTEPQETNSLYFSTHYDLASNLTFTSMAMYNARKSHSELYPSPYSFGAGGNYNADGKKIGIGANNPYNPFGVDLVGNASQYCPDGKTLGGAPVSSCTPNYLLDFYTRLPIEQGPRYNNDHVATETFRMGLNGFFDAIGNEWDWDLGYSYGNIYNSQNSVGVNDTTRIASQFDSPGAAPCNGPAQAGPGASGTWQEINGKYYEILQPGCVPFNPFGGYNAATGQGSITPEMIAYNIAHDLNTSSVTQRDYTANITGTLVNLPAGPLGVAVGGEYLELDGFDHPDNLAIQGNITSSGGANETGRTVTKAEYVEFNIPLLANVPFAKSLNVDLANRWSQFSWIGGEPGSFGAGIKHGANATTGRAQIRWQPTNSLLLRGSWAQGFRAPSLSDLYSGTSIGFPTLQDPCAPNSPFGGWDPSTPLPSGCNGIVRQQPSHSIEVISGGNPDLQPERAISRSFGFVYSPNWLPGFDIGADYYKIDLNNAIGSVASNYIMDQCYLEDNPQYCTHLTTSGNILTSISNGEVNVGESYSNGIDFNADYSLPATPIGDFRFNTNWTFVRSFVSVVPDAKSPTGFEAIEEAGYATDQIPKARGQVGINWNLGNWSAVWNVQYIGRVYERCTTTTIKMSECSEPGAIYGPTGTVGKNQLGTTIYHDVAVTYHIAPISTDFTFGIRNLFNKQFPVSLTSRNSFLPEMGYRIPGRFFYARVGVRF